MWLFVGVACAGRPAPTTAPAPEPPPPAAAPAPAPAPGSDLTGTWKSPPCGDRTWERTIVLEADGTYHGEDPISPCPPGVTCVWSGVVLFHGTWTADDHGVALTEAPVNGPNPAPRPARLDRKDGALTDAAGCRYQRY